MSTAALKYTALILMFIDHLGEFFPQDIPLWFRWVGRLSAPLFIFCLAKGLEKTRDRRKYILRLWASSAVMGTGNIFLILLFPNASVDLSNNIFSTMTLIAVIVWIVESFREDYQRKDNLNVPVYGLAGLVLVQTVGGFLGNWLTGFGMHWAKLMDALFPNVLFCEGGMDVVILGLILYFCGKKKKSLTIGYLAYCGMELFMAVRAGLIYGNMGFMFRYFYQWMMAGSLPLMLCYNGKKGKSSKVFFYLFYPLHIWLLFILSNVLM